MPAAPRRTSKPKITPLTAAITSKKNTVRVTRRADGSVRFKFGGALGIAAAACAVLAFLPFFAPEMALPFAFLLGGLVGAGLSWVAWTWVVERRLVDASPDGNHFEGTRRRTGATSIAAKGTAAWVVTGGLAVALFMVLYPLARWGLYVGLGIALAAGAGLIYLRLKPRRVPVE